MNARLNAIQKRSIAVGCGFVAVLAVVAVAVGFIIVSIVNSVDPREPSARPVAGQPAGGEATIVSVIDGDTIKTSEGNVRIIGIDSPERGECGYHEALDAVRSALQAGDTVRLEQPAATQARDRYGRLLRYVDTDTGIDIGLMQLEAGNAVARYDATDGYPEHPRESEYHAAQTATIAPDGSVIIAACE